jgi:RNA polymerase sigma-70 factor, ECF subfamily
MPDTAMPLPSHDTARAGVDMDLVRAAARGDAQAMDRLLRRTQEVALRFGILVCGHPEDAEDVMQDALLKTYLHVGTIREPDAFRTWLYRTVRNACLTKRRRRSGEPRRVTSMEQGEAGEAPIDVADPAPGPEALAFNAKLGERLRDALHALPPPFRVVVLLREVQGLSTRETAAAMGISEDNVKTRLRRARNLLRDRLTEFFE